MKTTLCSIMFLFIFSFVQIETASAQPEGNDAVIMQGNPPLTQSTIDKSVAFLEWSLNVRLPTEDKSRIQEVFIRNWQTDNRAFINGMVEGVDNYEQILQLTEEQRNILREQLQAGMLKSIRSNPNNELNRMLLKAYEVSRSPNSKPSTTTNDSANQALANNPNKQNKTTPARQSDSSELWTFSESASLTTEQAKILLQQALPANTNKAVADNTTLSFEKQSPTPASFSMNVPAARHWLLLMPVLKRVMQNARQLPQAGR